MSEGDYVLGTRDDEVERLGLQHRVWRGRVLEGWRRTGIAPGMTVIDVGAGPGFAATDLAGIVGPTGRVIALERSTHFLTALRARAGRLGLANIDPVDHDVSASPFPVAGADASWCRWLLSFVADPAATIAHIATSLKSGGIALFHEYADYATWRLMPPDPLHERFRTLVMQSWRDAGGEPDIALAMPRWLADNGLEIIAARVLGEIVAPTDFSWQWPRAFMATNAVRLNELGYIGEEEVSPMAELLDRVDPTARMMTPLVAEFICRKR